MNFDKQLPKKDATRQTVKCIKFVCSDVLKWQLVSQQHTCNVQTEISIVCFPLLCIENRNDGLQWQKGNRNFEKIIDLMHSL